MDESPSDGSVNDNYDDGHETSNDVNELIQIVHTMREQGNYIQM